MAKSSDFSLILHRKVLVLVKECYRNAIFYEITCDITKIVVSLQCVFHSIRFKVNKGLGPSGDPFFL